MMDNDNHIELVGSEITAYPTRYAYHNYESGNFVVLGRIAAERMFYEDLARWIKGHEDEVTITSLGGELVATCCGLTLLKTGPCNADNE